MHLDHLDRVEERSRLLGEMHHENGADGKVGRHDATHSRFAARGFEAVDRLGREAAPGVRAASALSSAAAGCVKSTSAAGWHSLRNAARSSSRPTPPTNSTSDAAVRAGTRALPVLPRWPARATLIIWRSIIPLLPTAAAGKIWQLDPVVRFRQ